MPNKTYNLLLHLYAALQQYFDKTGKPGDFDVKR